MSKATWEEEIEERLDTILKEVKLTQEMVGNCMSEPAKPEPKKATPVVQAPPKEQDGKTEYTPINTLQVGAVSKGDNKIIIKGTINYASEPRSGTRKDGSPYTVVNLTIEDGTGEIKISFWDKFADEAMTYKEGDLVLIDGVYQITDTYKNTLQAQAGKFYKMAKLN